MNKGFMYDIVIIGGGPAGSTAAYYTAKNENLKIVEKLLYTKLL